MCIHTYLICLEKGSFFLKNFAWVKIFFLLMLILLMYYPLKFHKKKQFDYHLMHL